MLNNAGERSGPRKFAFLTYKYEKSEIRTLFLSVVLRNLGRGEDVSPSPSEYVTAGGLVVGFNGGKYAIPYKVNNMSL